MSGVKRGLTYINAVEYTPARPNNKADLLTILRQRTTEFWISSHAPRDAFLRPARAC